MPAFACFANRIALALAMLVATWTAAGCAAKREASFPATQVIGGDVDDLDPASLALAAERSAAALEQSPPQTFPFAGARVSSADLAASARRVAAIARSEGDAARLTKRLAAECSAVRAGEAARVTAYYEPVLSARLRPDERFRYPLYRLPSPGDVARLRKRFGRVPTRADIDGRHALRGLGLELAWVDDDVARFFLHVQGSGVLVLGDGSRHRIGFAGSNGLAYRSIGARMLEQGLIAADDASAPAMRAWLAAHPQRRDALLFHNPRYVFFRDTGVAGPVGAMGTTLVAGRSIAGDDRYVPRGILVWLRTTRPVVDERGRQVGKAPLARFAFAQDAGAAIRGPARVDLFEGSGEEAGARAGRMNEAGELSLLMCGHEERGRDLRRDPVPVAGLR